MAAQPMYEGAEAMEPPMPQPDSRIPVEWGFKQESPRVELARIMGRASASANNEARDIQRAKDQEAMPSIQADMIATQKHAEEIRAQIAKAQEMLQSTQAPQYQEPKLGIHDIAGAAISALIGGPQAFNQAVTGSYDRNEKLAQQRYREQMLGHEANRENVMMLLRQLTGDENVAQRAYETIQQRLWETQRDERNFEQTRILKKDDQEWRSTEKALDRELKKKTTGWQQHKGYVLQAVKGIQASADLTQAQKAAAIAQLYKSTDEDVWDEPDIQAALGTQSFADKSTAAGTEGKLLKNELDRKTLNDKVAIIAASKGLKEGQLTKLTKDLEHYDDDRALKVATARARLAAIGRSNRGSGGSLSPTEARMQETTRVSSLKELLELNIDQLREVVGDENYEYTDDGGAVHTRKATPTEIVAKASKMAATNPAAYGLLKEYRETLNLYTDAVAKRGGVSGGDGKASGGGGSTVDGERAKALKALARASSDEQKRKIKALYKQRTGKDLY